MSENWEKLNDAIKTELNLAPTLTVRVYKDLSSAILEIAQGTAQFFTHKKSLGFIKGQTAAFDFLLPHFYKEAFQIKHTSHLQIENAKEWVEALNKDTSFVIYAEDHPVTGEVYTFCDELDQLLNEKRIFSIRVSHARFAFEDLAVRPYSVRICSWDSELAIAMCGERFRSPPMVAHRQYWKNVEVISQLQALKSVCKADADGVRAFEDMLVQKHLSIQAWFAAGSPRLWDRAVLNFTDISGEALRSSILAQVSGQGLDLKIETTNMCRWQATHLYQNWWEPAPKDEVLRGLVIFDAAILGAKDFSRLVLSSYDEVRKLQTW